MGEDLLSRVRPPTVGSLAVNKLDACCPECGSDLMELPHEAVDGGTSAAVSK